MSIRPGRPEERSALEALQLRASLIWEEYRADLEAHPSIVELGDGALEEGRVRVAVAGDEIVGFAEWSVTSEGEWELDGLFVEPERMRLGVGGRLVAEVARLARESAVRQIAVIANPRAEEFYSRQGFRRTGEASTLFGPALRMQLALAS